MLLALDSDSPACKEVGLTSPRSPVESGSSKPLQSKGKVVEAAGIEKALKHLQPKQVPQECLMDFRLLLEHQPRASTWPRAGTTLLSVIPTRAPISAAGARTQPRSDSRQSCASRRGSTWIRPRSESPAAIRPQPSRFHRTPVIRTPKSSFVRPIRSELCEDVAGGMGGTRAVG
jgi:hypothetical protein